MIVVLLPTELARRMVARLGKPGHRQAYPCSCVLGAIVRGRQRGHIREKFRAAKRLIIPGPGGRFQKVVMGRFSRRRSAATLLPANFSARRFRSARSLLLREKRARGHQAFAAFKFPALEVRMLPSGIDAFRNVPSTVAEWSQRRTALAPWLGLRR
jgi:hypothetical protein